MVAVDVGIERETDRPFIKGSDGIPDLVSELKELVINHHHAILACEDSNIASRSFQHINIVSYAFGGNFNSIPVLLGQRIRGKRNEYSEDDRPFHNDGF